jgi:hypothetical protein
MLIGPSNKETIMSGQLSDPILKSTASSDGGDSGVLHHGNSTGTDRIYFLVDLGTAAIGEIVMNG